MNRKIADQSEFTREGKGRELALIGLMTSLLCILGPLSVPLPFSPVPISLTNLGIYFALYVLGRKRGCISYLIYLLMGFIGIPVFSGFTGGPAKLLGPTGGYLIGFILMGLLAGVCIDKKPYRPFLCLLGMAAGTAVCYLFGTFWLAEQADLTFGGALAAGVIPFLPGDFVKMLIAMTAGPVIRKRLQSAGLF